LPPGAEAYRTIGPFDAGSLPSGLRRTHDLKDGTWGKVELLSGTLGFVWEDQVAEAREYMAPAEIIVPPQIPHHVEGENFVLTITFYRG